MTTKKLLTVALSLVMLIVMLSVCGLTTVSAGSETIALDPSIISDSNTGDGSKDNPIIIKQDVSRIPLVLYTTTDKDWIAMYGDGITNDSYYSSYMYLTDSWQTFPARGANNGNAATLTWPLPAGTSYCIKLFENDSYNVNQTIYFKVEGTTTTTTTVTKPSQPTQTVTDGGVYVDCTNGLDTNDGSKTSPLKTLAAAVDKINDLGLTGSNRLVNVVKCDWNGASMDFTSCDPYTEMITVEFPNNTLWITSEIRLAGPLNLNAAIGDSANQNRLVIYSYGNDITFGPYFEDVKGTEKGQNTLIRHGYRRSYHNLTADATTGNIDFGAVCPNYDMKVGGTGYLNAEIVVGNGADEPNGYVNYKNVKVTLDNPNMTVKVLNLSNGGNHRSSGHTSAQQNRYEQLTVEFNNFVAVEKMIGATYYNATYAKKLQFIFNNGTKAKVTDNLIYGGWGNTNMTADTKWVMECQAKAGSYLEATATAGTYTVKGGIIAKAVNADGKEYFSDEGTLTVPAGTYTVTFGDVPYVNLGNKIVVYEDSAIDLTQEGHADLKDKLFIGWVDATGAPVANTGTRSAGTVLTAKYVDMSKAVGGDLYVNGVQMRTEGVQGLRFIIGRSDALNAAFTANGITPSEEGTLAIPSELLGTNALVYGGTDVAAIKAVNTFPEYENGVAARRLFTGVLTNLTGKYARVYTVRAYVKFTDLNGNAAIAYSDEYATALYGVATTTLAEKSDELEASVVTELQNVVATVKQEAIDKYNALPHNAPVYADSGIHSNVLVNTALINSLKSSAFDGFDFYHLGAAGKLNQAGDKVEEGGLIVGDITINAGLGGDAVTIVQLSDLHFNYLNQQDLDEANPTLLSTYANRGFGKGNVPGVRKAAEFALIADQVVVTGDGIDYLSHGTIELLYKEIWNKFPSALITGGNHEYEQQMQGSVPDTLTMEEKMNWVKSAWKHDYEYTSQMVGEKVMAIQMDNGRRDAQGYYSFAAGTAAKLEADLAKAKAGGYTVLVFCHVGLYTNNAAETDTKAIFVNDLYSRFDTANRNIIDFGENSKKDFCGYDGMDPNSETAKVYNLLTNNADVVKGVFNGHMHSTFYTEIEAKTSTGAAAVIPQYTMTGTAYYHGHATKITVK